MARTEFCYHSLQRIFSLYTTIASSLANVHTLLYTQIPDFLGDLIRIPGSHPARKGELQEIFRIDDAETPNSLVKD